MNTSWKHIFTCKSRNIKHVWNTKTSQYRVIATPHYYRKTFCGYSYILVAHCTASTIWGLQILGLVGMVSYHYMLPIFNKVVSVGPILIWAVVICSNIYNICNLNDTLPICPDGSNCTQVWMKLFQLPKYDQGCWNLPKCF